MFLLFPAYFHRKLDKLFREKDIIYNLPFVGLRAKSFCFIVLMFSSLDPDSPIRIFLQIQIQEAKILRIQRIRILSSDKMNKVPATVPSIHVQS